MKSKEKIPEYRRSLRANRSRPGYGVFRCVNCRYILFRPGFGPFCKQLLKYTKPERLCDKFLKIK